jgi:dihydroxy-acid dehydratase
LIEGLDRTPHRAFLRAVGVDEADFGKPMIGIVSQHGENTPCSMSLGPQADAARLGVAAGQGIPVPFTTVSVSDGLSMNHKGMRMSLVSRELVADSIEAVMVGPTRVEVLFAPHRRRDPNNGLALLAERLAETQTSLAP